MNHDRLIFPGLTDKELLRQTTHGKKTSIFERNAPALAGITERPGIGDQAAPLPHLSVCY